MLRRFALLMVAALTFCGCNPFRCVGGSDNDPQECTATLTLSTNEFVCVLYPECEGITSSTFCGVADPVSTLPINRCERVRRGWLPAIQRCVILNPDGTAQALCYPSCE